MNVNTIKKAILSVCIYDNTNGLFEWNNILKCGENYLSINDKQENHENTNTAIGRVAGNYSILWNSAPCITIWRETLVPWKFGKIDDKPKIC